MSGVTSREIVQTIGGDVFVLGSTKPTAANSGVPSNATLTDYTGSLTISTSGGYYYRMRFRRSIVLTGSNNVFEECKFDGIDQVPSALIGLVRCNSGVNNQFLKCTFQPNAPLYYWNGITGSNYYCYRCAFLYCSDSFNIKSISSGQPMNVKIEGCYSPRQLSFFSPSPTNSDHKTHNDVIQFFGGAGPCSIVGNNLSGFVSPNRPDITTPGPADTAGGNVSLDQNGVMRSTKQSNSCIFIKPDSYQISGISITDNWLEGGEYTVHCANPTGGIQLGDIGQIIRNRFSKNSYQTQSGPSPWVTITMPASATCYTGDGTADANYYEDDITEIYVRHNNG